MDQSTYEVRLAQWTEIVQAATTRPADILLKDWLCDNGISKDQYYYWQRKVRAHAYDSMQKATNNTSVSTVAFAEVPMSLNYSGAIVLGIQHDASPAAVINIRGISISLFSNASSELIS